MLAADVDIIPGIVYQVLYSIVLAGASTQYTALKTILLETSLSICGRRDGEQCATGAREKAASRMIPVESRVSFHIFQICRTY